MFNFNLVIVYISFYHLLNISYFSVKHHRFLFILMIKIFVHFDEIHDLVAVCNRDHVFTAKSMRNSHTIIESLILLIPLYIVTMTSNFITNAVSPIFLLSFLSESGNFHMQKSSVCVR